MKSIRHDLKRKRRDPNSPSKSAAHVDQVDPRLALDRSWIPMAPGWAANFNYERIFSFLDDFTISLLRLLNREWRDKYAVVFKDRSPPRVVTLFVNATRAQSDSEMRFFFRCAQLLPEYIPPHPHPNPIPTAFNSADSLIAMEALASMTDGDRMETIAHLFSISGSYLGKYAAHHGHATVALQLHYCLDVDFMQGLIAMGHPRLYMDMVQLKVETYLAGQGNPFWYVCNGILPDRSICDALSEAHVRLHNKWLKHGPFMVRHWGVPSESYLWDKSSLDYFCATSARIRTFGYYVIYVPDLFERIAAELTVESAKIGLLAYNTDEDQTFYKQVYGSGVSVTPEALLQGRRNTLADIESLCNHPDIVKLANLTRADFYNNSNSSIDREAFDRIYEVLAKNRTNYFLRVNHAS